MNRMSQYRPYTKSGSRARYGSKKKLAVDSGRYKQNMMTVPRNWPPSELIVAVQTSFEKDLASR